MGQSTVLRNAILGTPHLLTCWQFSLCCKSYSNQGSFSLELVSLWTSCFSQVSYYLVDPHLSRITGVGMKSSV